MKLSKAELWILPASLATGSCLAYSTICHWFGFLSNSKINRLEMLLVFGVIFLFLSWQLLKRGSIIRFVKISRRKIYLFIGAAVVVAAAVALFVLPPSQNSLISSQTKPDGLISSPLRLLWIGLRLSDFASLAVLLFLGEVILSTMVNAWGLILPVLPRLSPVLFPLVLILLASVVANVVISATDSVGMLHQLTPLSSNGMIALDEGSNTFLKNIRVYTILFENFEGWTLITPRALSDKLEINSASKLRRWGRVGSVVTYDYPTDLSSQAEKDLLALKNVTVENGEGVQYIAILVNDPNRKICFRTYEDIVFIVPVSLSPICEHK